MHYAGARRQHRGVAVGPQFGGARCNRRSTLRRSPPFLPTHLADPVQTFSGSDNPANKNIAVVAILEIFQLIIAILSRAFFEVYVRHRYLLLRTREPRPSSRSTCAMPASSPHNPPRQTVARATRRCARRHASPGGFSLWRFHPPSRLSWRFHSTVTPLCWRFQFLALVFATAHFKLGRHSELWTDFGATLKTHFVAFFSLLASRCATLCE